MDAAHRIDAALARIEAAAAARRSLADRHDRLRERVAEAVAAIDDLVRQAERD